MLTDGGHLRVLSVCGLVVGQVVEGRVCHQKEQRRERSVYRCSVVTVQGASGSFIWKKGAEEENKLTHFKIPFALDLSR